MRATRPRITSTSRRRGATSPRHGLALIIALMATVLIGALVAGAVYTSTQEYRIGRYATNEPRAMAVAEMGLNLAAAELRGQSRPIAQDGGSVVIPVAGVPLANGDNAEVVLTRLTDTTYMLTSTGSAGNVAGGATAPARTVRRTRLLLRHARPKINFLAALTSNGPTKIGGSSEISGNDAPPAGWTDCPTSLEPAKPALVTNDLDNVEISGTKVVLSGASPRIKEDAAAADTTTYFKYGDANWQSLAAMADIRLPAGWSGKPSPLPTVFTALSTCAYGDAGKLNWGEPFVATNHPCKTYFPLIYAEQDLHITGGRGQGILMVNGDLTVAGGFEFYGPVIVRGNLRTTGTGGHFNGGVMAANVELDQNVVLGDAVISYSTCAINKALTAAGAQRAVGNRSWASIY